MAGETHVHCRASNTEFVCESFKQRGSGRPMHANRDFNIQDMPEALLTFTTHSTDRLVFEFVVVLGSYKVSCGIVLLLSLLFLP